MTSHFPISHLCHHSDHTTDITIEFTSKNGSRWYITPAYLPVLPYMVTHSLWSPCGLHGTPPNWESQYSQRLHRDQSLSTGMEINHFVNIVTKSLISSPCGLPVDSLRLPGTPTGLPVYSLGVPVRSQFTPCGVQWECIGTPSPLPGTPSPLPETPWDSHRVSGSG